MIPAGDTRVADLSLAELLAAFQGAAQAPAEPAPEIQPLPALEYGIGGIRRLFHCGKTQAHRIKGSGVLDPAITQVGKLIIIDVQKALAIWKGLEKKPKYKY